MENKETSIENGFPTKSVRVLIEKSDIKYYSICSNSIVHVQVDENVENTQIISDFLTFDDTQRPNLEIETTEFLIEENYNLNISPNLSEPGVDHLAIDEFNIEEVVTPNIVNDSQFSLSKENIIYIVDVDDIKENTSNENPTIKLTSLENIHGKNGDKILGSNYGSTKNIFLHKTSTITKTTLGANSSDENETPSDGSDSGLGLESSVLQKDCSDSNSVLRRRLKSSLKRKSGTLTAVPPNKRGKKSIKFGNVKIFYFPRIQGFCCVPSQGGCTLGMGAKHVQTKTYKLNEHANLKNGDDKIPMQLCTAKISSSDETDSDEKLSEENISDFNPDSSGFLQPVPVKTRRVILKAAGIKNIDSTEKDECRAISSSREYCGCLCRGFCDPDTCSCSQGGIKCQVDRPNFPCECSRDGCGNINGRIEFNPGRVRTHFIHTIMRLEVENKSKTTFLQETQGYFKNSNPTDCATFISKTI